MEIFDYDFKKCIECRNELNKNGDICKIYKDNCSHSDCIGNCTNLYYELKPVDYYDFYQKYLEYAKNHINWKISYRGLTYEELYNLSVNFKTLVEEQTNFKYDLEVYFYTLVCHIIIETFIGQDKEKRIMKYIEERGFKYEKVTGFKDSKNGVDILVKGNNTKFYVQVKPISFFLSKKIDVHEDRVACCYKREEVLKREGIDTYYIIYDLDWQTLELKWVVNKKGGLLFKLSELLKYNKENITETIEKLHIPKERIEI